MFIVPDHTLAPAPRPNGGAVGGPASALAVALSAARAAAANVLRPPAATASTAPRLLHAPAATFGLLENLSVPKLAFFPSMNFDGFLKLLPGAHKSEGPELAFGHLTAEQVDAENKQLIDKVFSLLNDSNWKVIAQPSSKMTISKRYLESDVSFGGGDTDRAHKFAVVKATATLRATPEAVYELFLDNSRVHEYNEFCRRVSDIEFLHSKRPHSTKITWAGSARIAGVFKPRDFVTRVHFATLKDGTKAVVNRPEVHPRAKPTDDYVRAEILLAGNFIRPVQGHPELSEVTSVTYVNPGGIADTKVGAAVVNAICAKGPIKFFTGLENAANKPKK